MISDVDSLTPSPYSTPRTRSVIDAHSFQTKVQQLYDEMTENKKMSEKMQIISDKRRSHKEENGTERMSSRRGKNFLNQTGECSPNMLRSNKDSFKLYDNNTEHDDTQLIFHNKTSRVTRRSIKKHNQNVYEEVPCVNIKAINGNRNIESDGNLNSEFNRVNFMDINVVDAHTTDKINPNDRQRRKSKYEIDAIITPLPYGKNERSVRSNILKMDHQQECTDGTNSEHDLSQINGIPEPLLPNTESSPISSNHSEKSRATTLLNHMTVPPGIKEYDATGLEISNLVKSLFPPQYFTYSM